jgi:cysteine desulfurase
MEAALEAWDAERVERPKRLARLRDRLESSLCEALPWAVIIGKKAPRLPHTSCIAFPGLDRQALMMAFDLAGVACSTGSACASGSSEPSPVLLAMGRLNSEVGGALRLSLGAQTAEAEVDEASRRICRIVRDQQASKTS